MILDYSNNKRKRSAPAFVRRFIDFFYEWHYPHPIRYGGGPQGYRTFRWERLFIVLANILLIVITILVALDVI